MTQINTIKIIGHRGAGGLAPENTLAAIQKALEYGVDEIEVDVRVTADGIPILNHNRTVIASGKPISIAHHTLVQLRAVKPDVATLDEALRYVAGRSILHLEIKFGEPVGAVAAVLTPFLNSNPATTIVLGSKSQKVLRELHTEFPAVTKVVIEPWSGLRAAYRAKQIGARRISMRSWWLWKGFLRHMYSRGYLMVPYTINDPRTVLKWEPYIYGIVTDYPDRFPASPR